MTHKILSLFAVLVLGAAITACGGDSGGGESNPDNGSNMEWGNTDVPTDTVQPDATETTETITETQTEIPPVCQSDCDDEWAKECAGAGIRTCQDNDDDGCFTWSEAEACPNGTTCANGACVASCPDQPCTTAGAKKCEGATTVVECGDFDADGCFEWGNGTACGAGLVCSGGFCATTCQNECTVSGAVKCEGNNVVTCGDANNDGCLEWGSASPCGAGLVCSSGFCAATCESECTTEGAKKCEANGVTTCGDYNNDGCLEWGSAIICEGNTVCSSGVCQDTCQNECTVALAVKCDGNGVSTCGDYNLDGCMEWGTAVACGGDLVCSNGVCTETCQSECTVADAKKCDGNGVTTCKDYNDDGCLEWGSPEACEDGTTCSSGTCVTNCTDACVGDGSKACVAGTTKQFHVCGDYNDDGCLEWGSDVACDDTMVCADGECAATCTDGCANTGDLQCAGNAIETCGDYNADGCIEWGTAVPCESSETCTDGACVDKVAPAGVLLNEILYDGISTDEDSFVELRGPVGTVLDGFSIVGLNGNGGAVYKTIPLNGIIGVNGLWVIMREGAPTSWKALANVINDDVDFQNGPDSVQLRFGETIIDAVGYGEFTNDDTFLGEGNAAPDAGSEHSIGRNITGDDTDDNAADWFEFWMPTPGAENDNPNDDPVALLVCPQGGLVDEVLTFDATNSADDDGYIDFWDFDYGDGTDPVHGKKETVTHAFTAPNIYTVTLTVIDNLGGKDTDTCEVTIAADSCLDVDCSTIPDPVCQGDVERTYTGAGVCQDGTCVYPHDDKNCPAGCENGACKDDTSPYTIGWCRLQWPLEITNKDFGATEDVYGRVYVADLTNTTENANDPSPWVKAQVGYGPDASADPTADTWTWSDAAPYAGWDGDGDDQKNNDEYSGTLVIPSPEHSPYDYAFRFSADGGETWTLCDKDGSDNGYAADQAGHLAITGCTPGELCDGGNGYCNSFAQCVSSGGWVVIPAGTFTMGSADDEPHYDPWEAAHDVTLTHSFAMRATEIEAETFYLLTEILPDEYVDCTDDPDHCPINGITWHEAAYYCNQVSWLEDKDKCYTCTGDAPNMTCVPNVAYGSPYDCPGYRLPTEAEWEYAVRAGTTGVSWYGEDYPALNCDFNWVLNVIGWFCGNSDDLPHAVAWKAPNPWGLYDMLGNVEEWCHDGYEATALPAATDPLSPGDGSLKAVRGSHYKDYAAELRAAHRHGEAPTFRGTAGLRPVITLP